LSAVISSLGATKASTVSWFLLVGSTNLFSSTLKTCLDDPSVRSATFGSSLVFERSSGVDAFVVLDLILPDRKC